jgi:hypothetical protein
MAGLRRAENGSDGQIMCTSANILIRETGPYVYTMTTLYDPIERVVHCTEGLTSSKFWGEDHLFKFNQFINTEEYSRDYFLDNRLSTISIMRIRKWPVSNWLESWRFLHGLLRLRGVCQRAPFVQRGRGLEGCCSTANSSPFPIRWRRYQNNAYVHRTTT